MTFTTSELIQILGTGASVKLKQQLTTSELIQLAGIAKRNKAHLTIRQRLTVSEMIQIAGTGTGKADECITFDFNI